MAVLDVPGAGLHAPVIGSEQADAVDAAIDEGGAELGGMVDVESAVGVLEQ